MLEVSKPLSSSFPSRKQQQPTPVKLSAKRNSIVSGSTCVSKKHPASSHVSSTSKATAALKAALQQAQKAPAAIMASSLGQARNSLPAGTRSHRAAPAIVNTGSTSCSNSLAASSGSCTQAKLSKQQPARPGASAATQQQQQQQPKPKYVPIRPLYRPLLPKPNGAGTAPAPGFQVKSQGKSSGAFHSSDSARLGNTRGGAAAAAPALSSHSAAPQAASGPTLALAKSAASSRVASPTAAAATPDAATKLRPGKLRAASAGAASKPRPARKASTTTPITTKHAVTTNDSNDSSTIPTKTTSSTENTTAMTPLMTPLTTSPMTDKPVKPKKLRKASTPGLVSKDSKKPRKRNNSTTTTSKKTSGALLASLEASLAADVSSPFVPAGPKSIVIPQNPAQSSYFADLPTPPSSISSKSPLSTSPSPALSAAIHSSTLLDLSAPQDADGDLAFGLFESDMFGSINMSLEPQTATTASDPAFRLQDFNLDLNIEEEDDDEEIDANVLRDVEALTSAIDLDSPISLYSESPALTCADGASDPDFAMNLWLQPKEDTTSDSNDDGFSALGFFGRHGSSVSSAATCFDASSSSSAAPSPATGAPSSRSSSVVTMTDKLGAGPATLDFDDFDFFATSTTTTTTKPKNVVPGKMADLDLDFVPAAAADFGFGALGSFF